MKKIYIIIFFLGWNLICDSQSIQWQKVFGGSREDFGNSIVKLNNGEFLVCGSSRSNDGDIYFHTTGNSKDVLLINIDSTGIVNWNNCFGGTSVDEGVRIIQTYDNKFLFLSNSSSTNGDVTGIHNHGPDFWLSKLFDQDSIDWGNCFGSFDYETAYDVIQTSDSGFIAMGETDGDDGDVSGNHTRGNKDIWVFKVDKNGILIWQVCLGSWTFDGAGALTATPDNGVLILGSTITGQGGTAQCSSTVLGENLWLVKLDSIGNVLWDKCYGSSGPDAGIDIVASPTGGYYVLGYSSFNDGDVTGNHGMVDNWLLRVNDSGDLLWQNCYGGAFMEEPHSIALAPNGDVLMCGLTESTNGQAASNHGSNDVFVVRTDSSGNLLWSQCYGGTGNDVGYSITVASDGNPAFTGFVESNDGDVSGNHGGRDLWVVKLSDSPISVNEIPNPLINFETSYSNDQLSLSFVSAVNANCKLVVYNLLGEEVFVLPIKCSQGANRMQFSTTFYSGLFIVCIQSISASSIVKKMVVY